MWIVTFFDQIRDFFLCQPLRSVPGGRAGWKERLSYVFHQIRTRASGRIFLVFTKLEHVRGGGRVQNKALTSAKRAFLCCSPNWNTCLRKDFPCFSPTCGAESTRQEKPKKITNYLLMSQHISSSTSTSFTCVGYSHTKYIELPVTQCPPC